MIRLLFGLAAMLTACGGEPGCPQQQDNRILSENHPDSIAYLRELHRKISSNLEGTDYYFEKRDTFEGQTRLVLNCYGEDFCGTLKILLQQEDSFTVRLQNNGGYRGAQLRGLKLNQTGNDEQPHYFYRKMDKIVD